MSFPRYACYRETGVEWLGEVPSHWEVGPLKRLVRFQSGESITSESIEANGAFPVFGGNGLRGYAEAFTHDGEFVLIGRQGALCGNINYAVGQFWASEHALVAHPCASFSTRWLGEVLRVMDLGQYSTSAAQPGVSAEVLANLRCPVPPLFEQRSIADFLDREIAKIDAMVEAQRRLIALLKEKRQSVISHAVTRGLDPAVPLKPSGVEWLGDIPARWEVVRLANIYREVGDAADVSLPILSVSIHSGVSDEEVPEEDLERKVWRSEDRSKYKSVSPNDLVYNMMRAWQGGFGTVKIVGAVSPAYVVARPKRNIVTKFVEWLMRTPSCIEEMRRNSVGVADFRLRLYWDEAKNIEVAIPEVAEQRRILAEVGSKLKRCETLVKEGQSLIALLQERRAALISAAVTGKIDVRGLVATPAVVQAA